MNIDISLPVNDNDKDALSSWLTGEASVMKTHVRTKVTKNTFMLIWKKSHGNKYKYGKWFEPRSISCLPCVIVRVSVVFRKTSIVVGHWRFDYLSGSHLQRQVKSEIMVFMHLVVVLNGQLFYTSRQKSDLPQGFELEIPRFLNWPCRSLIVQCSLSCTFPLFNW